MQLFQQDEEQWGKFFQWVSVHRRKKREGRKQKIERKTFSELPEKKTGKRGKGVSFVSFF